MKSVQFGATGVMVSELCLGTMMFADRCDYAASEAIVNAALAHGINFVDTAAMYSSGACEEFLGRILKGKRDQVFLGTKVVKGIDRQSILSGLDESLARLQTDRVDLYMIHWPVQGMDVAEVMQALNDTVVSGKARFVGCCNYPAWLVAHSNAIAERNGWARLICNQVAYNLIERGVEVEILPQAVAEKIAITAYRPLAIGLLAGKFSTTTPMPAEARGKTDARVITWLSQHGSSIDRFNRLAKDRGIHPANLATAWVRYSDAVTCPIVGVSSLRQLEETIQGAEIDLTADEYAALTDLFTTEVKEEGLQLFPGLKYNFPRLRRNLHLVGQK
jgi:aryl-alcohol dehydrogenase-like predicted oxidoreductase